MLSTILGVITGKIGIGLGVLVLGYILKKIPNAKLKPVIHKVFKGFGVFITLGATVWMRGIWNKIVEPYFIDLLDNVISGALEGFIDGLRTDNK